MSKDEILPDDLRCRRTDGREWRCSRRVLDGKKLCQIHYLQGRRRQLKQKVPESLKLERKSKKIQKNCGKIGVSSRPSKTLKIQLVENRKRCASEALDEALRRMKLKKGDLQLELIREFLKRQVEKKNKKKKKKDTELSVATELTRELPNGIMAISQKNLDNAGGFEAVDVKIGPIPASCSFSGLYPERSFRSKNIEPLPIGKMQVLPFVDKLRKGKKCHWCRRTNDQNLIRCLKCRKRFFCTNCIKQRYFEKQEIKVACPVCRGTCSCRICKKYQSWGVSCKDFYRDKRKVCQIQLLHYLIHILLPVLKQLNEDQSIEIEIEALMTGNAPSAILIQQSEIGYNKLYCCNNCKTSIVDYHRSCTNCSYSLCLSCCWEFCRGSLCAHSEFRGKNGKNMLSDELQLKIKQISTFCRSRCNMPFVSSMSLQKGEACDDGSICCPPADFGGCGEKMLDLRCMFPSSWMKELEVGAEEVLRSCGIAETSDLSSSCCSLCKGTNNKDGEIKLLQKTAKRLDSNDNFLYCPTMNDLHDEKLEHFQQHWAKGHPVIVRNVLRSTSVLSWDPVVMFCTYLEEMSCKSQKGKEAVTGTTCLDWCEVETATKKIFMGSLADETHANMRHQMIKIKAWLSSHLFQEQFPSHYAEILCALPLQEYVNPISGVLNLVCKLPQETPKPEIGPCIHISYGGTEELMQSDFLTKLCCDSYDVVNILAYATDAPISREQVNKIKGLMKKYKARDRLQSSSNSTNQKGKSSLRSEESEECGFQDTVGEKLPLFIGISEVPFNSSNLKGRNSSYDNEIVSHDSETDSDSDSEASILCSGNLQRSEDTDDECFFRDYAESSSSSGEKQIADACAAQWDIFRRQDVSKLLEYLRRHSDEFGAAYSYTRQVVHPIHDQTFFLDAFHKMKLKEEFDIQPWTFEQRPGEAVIIPAGCPYQIRKLKSCVNVVLDFISPENAAECIRLTDEIRLLPMHHKARGKVLEVRKMTVRGINAAIGEIQNLMCKDCIGKIVQLTQRSMASSKACKSKYALHLNTEVMIWVPAPN